MKKLGLLVMIPLLGGCSASLTGNNYKELKENQILYVWYGNNQYSASYGYSVNVSDGITNIKYKIERASACVDVYVKYVQRGTNRLDVFGGTDVTYVISER